MPVPLGRDPLPPDFRNSKKNKKLRKLKNIFPLSAMHNILPMIPKILHFLVVLAVEATHIAAVTTLLTFCAVEIYRLRERKLSEKQPLLIRPYLCYAYDILFPSLVAGHHFVYYFTYGQLDVLPMIHPVLYKIMVVVSVYQAIINAALYFSSRLFYYLADLPPQYANPPLPAIFPFLAYAVIPWSTWTVWMLNIQQKWRDFPFWLPVSAILVALVFTGRWYLRRPCVLELPEDGRKIKAVGDCAVAAISFLVLHYGFMENDFFLRTKNWKYIFAATNIFIWPMIFWRKKLHTFTFGFFRARHKYADETTAKKWIADVEEKKTSGQELFLGLSKKLGQILYDVVVVPTGSSVMDKSLRTTAFVLRYVPLSYIPGGAEVAKKLEAMDFYGAGVVTGKPAVPGKSSSGAGGAKNRAGATSAGGGGTSARGAPGNQSARGPTASGGTTTRSRNKQQESSEDTICPPADRVTWQNPLSGEKTTLPVIFNRRNGMKQRTGAPTSGRTGMLPEMTSTATKASSSATSTTYGTVGGPPKIDTDPETSNYKPDGWAFRDPTAGREALRPPTPAQAAVHADEIRRRLASFLHLEQEDGQPNGAGNRSGAASPVAGAAQLSTPTGKFDTSSLLSTPQSSLLDPNQASLLSGYSTPAGPPPPTFNERHNATGLPPLQLPQEVQSEVESLLDALERGMEFVDEERLDALLAKLHKQ
ncbi:unnamed protein product [Amoebophrya sp. A120]|nr:unnamed protein product [Amoebophrya sp. A120]|eukprot:GSA120T00017639001.1